MDIDEFYEADPRRRASAELELGSEWLGKDGVQHELNYVEDTGELYVLREPQPHVREDPFGGIHVSDPPGYENKITVHVIAKIDTVDELHKILEGLARGHARAGQPGHALARPAPAGGGRRRGADGRPHFRQLGRRLQVEHLGQELGGDVVGCHVASSLQLSRSKTRFESRYMTTAKRKPEKIS